MAYSSSPGRRSQKHGPLSTGFDAICWKLFRQDLFYGTADGIVYQGLSGFLDGVAIDGSGGTAIEFEAQQAFTSLKYPGPKYVSMVRPSVVSGAIPTILVGVLFDYNVETVFGDLATAEIDAAFWDSGLWDIGLWGSGLLVNREWTTVGGQGYTCSIRFKGRATDETFWIATDWIIVGGAGL
jgi:hypothetical protein